MRTRFTFKLGHWTVWLFLPVLLLIAPGCLKNGGYDMPIEPVEAMEDQGVYWTRPTPSLQCHHGMHPAAIPPGGFSVAAGCQGDVDGAIRKGLGFRLVADLACDGQFAGLFGHWDACHAFSIRQRGTDSKIVAGLIFHESDSDECYIAYLVGDHHEGGSPNSPLINFCVVRQYEGVELDVNETGRCVEADSVISNGYWVYFLNADGELHDTLWFEGDEFVPGDPPAPAGGATGVDTFWGWRKDFMLIPFFDLPTFAPSVPAMARAV